MPRKQKALPGMDPPVIEEIEAAAQEYYKVQQKRIKLLASETEAGQKLMEAMKTHKLTDYVFEGMKVFIESGKEKVRVRTLKEEQEEKNDEKEGEDF